MALSAVVSREFFLGFQKKQLQLTSDICSLNVKFKLQVEAWEAVGLKILKSLS